MNPFRILIYVGGVVFLLLLAGCAQKQDDTRETLENGIDESTMTIFKSASCGCCGIYSKYIEGKNFDVDVKIVENIESIKNEYSIPAQMRSCHTGMIGGYIIEGHIPVEAINKLLLDKPDIRGIALPGMPAGSPGMSGTKAAPFVIYALNKDGTTSEFMRV